MKIVKLTAENIKRLNAIEISPEGNMITIGGKNGAGKSSVLDSIAYALGGQALVPSKPIKKGKTDAMVEVELDEYIVTRQFKLKAKICNCFSSPHEKLCDSSKPPTLQSSLSIKNSDGATQTSPQALLDSLLGKLTFDPLAFIQVPSKEQAKILRVLVNLDTSDLETERAELFVERTHSNRKIKSAESQLAELTVYDKVGKVEISMEEVSTAMLEAEQKREESENLQQRAASMQYQFERSDSVRIDKREKIAMLEAQLKSATEELERLDNEAALRSEEAGRAEAKAKEAKKNLPNIEKIRERITVIESTNKMIRSNNAYTEKTIKLNQALKHVAELTLEIDRIDHEWKKRLDALKFPIDGLGLSSGVVMWNDLPLGQASTAEQLRVSVAIGLALNPKLKVLLIHDGSSLDSDSLAAIAKQAADADAQLWLERVAESKEGVQVMIEDGSVV